MRRSVIWRPNLSKRDILLLDDPSPRGAANPLKNKKAQIRDWIWAKGRGRVQQASNHLLSKTRMHSNSAKGGTSVSARTLVPCRNRRGLVLRALGFLSVRLRGSEKQDDSTPLTTWVQTIEPENGARHGHALIVIKWRTDAHLRSGGGRHRLVAGPSADAPGTHGLVR